MSRDQSRLRYHRNTLPYRRRRRRLPTTQFNLRKQQNISITPKKTAEENRREQAKEEVPINTPIFKEKVVGTIEPVKVQKPRVTLQVPERNFHHYPAVAEPVTARTEAATEKEKEPIEPLPTLEVPVSASPIPFHPREEEEVRENEKGIISQIPKSSKEHVAQIQSLLNSLVERKGTAVPDNAPEKEEDHVEEGDDLDDSVAGASEGRGVVYEAPVDPYPRSEVFEFIEDEEEEDHFNSPRNANPANDGLLFRTEIRSMVRAALCQIFSEQGFNGISFCHHLNYQGRRRPQQHLLTSYHSHRQSPVSHWQGYYQPPQQWGYPQQQPSIPYQSWNFQQPREYHEAGGSYHKLVPGSPGKDRESPEEHLEPVDQRPPWTYPPGGYHSYPGDPGMNPANYRLPRRSRVPEYHDQGSGTGASYELPSQPSESQRWGGGSGGGYQLPLKYPRKEVLPSVKQASSAVLQREFEPAPHVGASSWKPTKNARHD